MSLYEATLNFHVTPADLGILFQCKLYSTVLYPVSCLVEIKLFQNYFKL